MFVEQPLASPGSAKKCNAMKNKGEREKEENPSVEILTIKDNLTSCKINLKISSNKSCVKMVCMYNSHGFCKPGESFNFFHSLVI